MRGCRGGNGDMWMAMGGTAMEEDVRLGRSWQQQQQQQQQQQEEEEEGVIIAFRMTVTTSFRPAYPRELEARSVERGASGL